MNYDLLQAWATQQNSKTNDKLKEQFSKIPTKDKDSKINKTRSMLKDTIARCQLIKENVNKNNQHFAQIEEYIKILQDYGVANPLTPEKKA